MSSRNRCPLFWRQWCGSLLSSFTTHNKRVFIHGYNTNDNWHFREILLEGKLYGSASFFYYYFFLINKVFYNYSFKPKCLFFLMKFWWYCWWYFLLDHAPWTSRHYILQSQCRVTACWTHFMASVVTTLTSCPLLKNYARAIKGQC